MILKCVYLIYDNEFLFLHKLRDSINKYVRTAMFPTLEWHVSLNPVPHSTDFP